MSSSCSACIPGRRRTDCSASLLSLSCCRSLRAARASNSGVCVRADWMAKSTRRCPCGGAAAGGSGDGVGAAHIAQAACQSCTRAERGQRRCPSGTDGEAATRLQIRSCPRSPPWPAPRRCGGQAHSLNLARSWSGCRTSTLRQIRSELVRGEERTERERRVSDLGLRSDESDGFFCETSVGSVMGPACLAETPGSARATPYLG